MTYPRTHLVDRRPAHTPIGGEHLRTPAVDHRRSVPVALGLHGVVAEGIDVAVSAVVDREADGVEGPTDLPGRRVEPGHPMSVEDPHVRRIEHRLLQIDRVREVIEAHRDAFRDQRHGSLGLLRCDQVQCAAVVIRAPAAPVLLFVEPLQHLLMGHQTLGALGRGVPLGPLLRRRRDSALQTQIARDAERHHSHSRQDDDAFHHDGRGCHDRLSLFRAPFARS